MWHMPKVENDDVRALAAEIVQREGGYVNDSSDPGGATNFGVTIHTMRRLGLDLTGDGRVSKADVKPLSQAQAVDIFILHYFDKPRIVQLPNAMQASVFDMYVNAGSNAVKILQRMLSKMGFEYNADGAIGPQTIAAAVRAHDYAPLII
jgi:lysozyme family protein